MMWRVLLDIYEECIFGFLYLNISDDPIDNSLIRSYYNFLAGKLSKTETNWTIISTNCYTMEASNFLATN